MKNRTSQYRYEEEFKIKVVREVESGAISKTEASRKYNILGHATILKWCRQYGSKKKTYLEESKNLFMSQEDYEITRLQNENKLLKQELEDARMKSIVMETFVDKQRRSWESQSEKSLVPDNPRSKKAVSRLQDSENQQIVWQESASFLSDGNSANSGIC
ncbi:MAG TPA: transposase [Clostridia bacterium]